jgi:hypothetical protein
VEENNRHRAAVKELEMAVAELEELVARMKKRHLGIVRTHLGEDVTVKELSWIR